MRKFVRSIIVLSLLLGSVFSCGSCAKRFAGDVSGPAWTADRSAVDARLVRMLEWELYEDAEALADSMLTAGWRDPRLLGQKATAIGALGRVDEAIVLFEEAIIEDYESCDNHLNFAVLLMRAEMTGRAITELREAKQFCAGANRVTIFRNLAVGYIKTDRPDKALEAVDNGLLIAPKDPYLTGLKGMLIADDDPGQAERLLSVPISTGAEKPEFLYQYGILLLNSERYGMAIDVLERAMRARPLDLDIGEALALALFRAKRFDEAESIYRVLEKNGHARPLELARIYMSTKRYQEALDLLSRMEPTAETLDRSAMCLMSLGRIDDAVEMERKALSLRPDWPIAMVNLAVLLAVQGELDEARGLLERVLEIEPENTTAIQNIERIEKALEGAK